MYYSFCKSQWTATYVCNCFICSQIWGSSMSHSVMGKCISSEWRWDWSLWQRTCNWIWTTLCGTTTSLLRLGGNRIPWNTFSISRLRVYQEMSWFLGSVYKWRQYTGLFMSSNWSYLDVWHGEWTFSISAETSCLEHMTQNHLKNMILLLKIT